MEGNQKKETAEDEGGDKRGLRTVSELRGSQLRMKQPKTWSNEKRVMGKVSFGLTSERHSRGEGPETRNRFSEGGARALEGKTNAVQVMWGRSGEVYQKPQTGMGAKL